MEINVGKEVAALQRMTVTELRERYAEVFGETTTAGNKTWLVRRIAWRLQTLAEGDLSERAKARAAELACDADLRVTAPREKAVAGTVGPVRTGTLPREKADDRLPPPGTVLTRKYKSSVIQVKVLKDGFEYEGQVFGSLSAVAKAITGSHCNGFHSIGFDKSLDFVLEVPGALLDKKELEIKKAPPVRFRVTGSDSSPRSARTGTSYGTNTPGIEA